MIKWKIVKCPTLLIFYPSQGVSCCCIKWEIHFNIFLGVLQRFFRIWCRQTNSFNLQWNRLSCKMEYIYIRWLTDTPSINSSHCMSSVSVESILTARSQAIVPVLCAFCVNLAYLIFLGFVWKRCNVSSENLTTSFIK